MIIAALIFVLKFVWFTLNYFRWWILACGIASRKSAYGIIMIMLASILIGQNFMVQPTEEQQNDWEEHSAAITVEN